MSSASWSHLPPELRHLIIDILSRLGGRCSLLATVCREWQSVIEPLNFAAITLTMARLVDPGSLAILSRRRSQVRFVWFRVELKPYDCTRCANTDEELWGLDYADNKSIADAFENLFAVLSTWEPRGDLVLDVSIYSPSDNKHSFKYLNFRADTSLGASPSPFTPDDDDDEAHGWVAGRMVSAPTRFAIEKTFGEIMGEGPFDDEESEMEWWRSLPSVPVVGVVLLRHQTRRRWKPVALASMLTRFPNLSELCYEPWREWNSIQLHTDKRTRTMIGSLPWWSLRRLTIFENFNESYPGLYNQKYLKDCPAVRAPNIAVNKKLAQNSLGLTTLAASFMADARYFLEARQSSWTWEKLTCLALTSRVLTPDADALEVNTMLRDAATAALQMPRLDTMELWNGRRGMAMLFRYQRARNGQSVVITLRGTFGLNLAADTTHAWDMVAHRHRHGIVVSNTSMIDPAAIRCHGDAIRLLELSTDVLRPASLLQILGEHGLRTWDHHLSSSAE